MIEHRKNHALPSLSVIHAATRGENDALSEILHHYRGYITKLSMRHVCDQYGNSICHVDETLRERLEVKLVLGILTYKP